jgi:hypothetical protein
MKGWSPIPASNAKTPTLSLREKQRVDTDEEVRLAKAQIDHARQAPNGFLP